MRPVVAGVGSRVAVGFGTGTLLLDGRSGQVVGHTSLIDGVAAHDQDTILLGHCPAHQTTGICAYDTSTGHSVWTAAPPGGSVLLNRIETYGGWVYVLLSPSSGPTRLGILDQRTGAWQAQLPLIGIVHEIEPALYKVTSSGVVVGPPGGTGPYTVLTNMDT
jgi:hypothetical protein